MQKLMMTAALGCLAIATAADAHVAGTRSSHCGYSAGDTDTVLELALLDSRIGGALALA